MPSLPPELSFEALHLSPETLKAVHDMGFVRPTQVQASAYTPVLEGHDIMVQSQTGSGKTVAYGMPLAEMLNPLDKQVQALILLPTRELANQVAEELTKLFAHRTLSVAAVYGGAGMGGQIAELKSGVQVVAGTPGRLLDHLRRKTLSLSGLRILVLDEADEMLSMGFAKDLDAILEFLPKERQSLLFSATIPEDIRALAQRFLHNPEMVSLSKKVGAKEVTHYCYMVSGMGKQRDLVRIIKSTEPEDAIIFCNTREDTHFIASYLRRQGFDAEEISGDLPQSEREIVMGKIKRKELRFLVATDVAARGIDISELSHVFNYSIPEYHEVYIHRTGRTGRAGRSGTAISLVAPQELGNFVMIRKIYKLETTERELPVDNDELVESTSRRPPALEAAPAPAEPKPRPTPKPTTRADTKAEPKEPQTEAKPAKAEVEAKPEAKAEPKTAPAAEVKPVVKAEPKAEVKPEPKVEAKLEIESKPEAQVEAKPEAKVEPKAEVKPEPKTEAKAAPVTEVKPVAKAEPKPELKPEPKVEAKPEARPEPKPRPEPRNEERAKPEPKAQERRDAKPEPKATPLPTLSNETWGEPLDILLSPKEIRGKAEPRHQRREAEAAKPEPRRQEPRPEHKKPNVERPAPVEVKSAPVESARPTIEVAALPTEEEPTNLPEQEDATQPISGDIAAAFAEAMRETIEAQEQSGQTSDDEGDDEGDEAEGPDSVKMTRIYLNLGRRDHVRASEVTRFLREHVKLTRRDLGRVQVRDTFSHVGIRLDLAEQLLTSLQGQKFRNKEVIVELAKQNPNRRNNADNPQEQAADAPEMMHAAINIELESAIPEITLQEATLPEATPEASSAEPPAQPANPQEETPNQ